MSMIDEVEQAKLIEGAVISETPKTVRIQTGPGQEAAQDAAGEAEDANTTHTTEDAPQPTPIRVGSREFKTKLEADAYVMALEMQQANNLQFAELQNNIAKLNEQKNDDPFSVDGKRIEDVWFDDPRKAAEHLYNKALAEAERRIEAKTTKKTEQERFWDSFYKSNPDLKTADKFVKLELSQVLEREPNLPLDKAQEKIASSVRTELQAYLGANGVKKTELTKQKSTTLSPSGLDGSVGNTQSAKSVTFLDQIKSYRRNRKTS